DRKGAVAGSMRSPNQASAQRAESRRSRRARLATSRLLRSSFRSGRRVLDRQRFAHKRRMRNPCPKFSFSDQADSSDVEILCKSSIVAAARQPQEFTNRVATL